MTAVLVLDRFDGGGEGLGVDGVVADSDLPTRMLGMGELTFVDDMLEKEEEEEEEETKVCPLS